jgi:hypothetical protein
LRCPSCHSENPKSTKFCIECGAAFEHRCPKCAFDNLPQAKFCGPPLQLLGVNGQP